jgi:hypothetical protein
MALGPGPRKVVLASHLTVAVGWIGAVLAYLALGVAAETSSDTETIRGAWIAMELTGWYVIVPLAVASVLTGLVIALGTKWGLFRHYWVLLSFGLTALAALVLFFHMPTVSATTDLARGGDAASVEHLGGDIAHPAIGLVILVVVLVLNIYKPRGVTAYGRRKQREVRYEGRPAPTGVV